jgi:DNA-binding CsgD family transcriptional regulator
MSLADPWPAIEQVLGARAGVQVGPFETAVVESGFTRVPIQEYRDAMDRRRLVPLHQGGDALSWVGLARLEGRQVGTLGSIVATGRSVSAFAHVRLSMRRGELGKLTIESNLVGCLTLLGMSQEEMTISFRVALPGHPTVVRSDLMQGEPWETFWAKRLRLPPRLSRLAVLLVAGTSQATIARELRVSPKSVRKYTERLFALSGISNRSQLAASLLEHGRQPAGDPGSSTFAKSG